MTASSFSAPASVAAAPAPIRFGSAVCAEPAAGFAVQWRLRRHGSIAPRHLLASYAAICLVTLAIAIAFWWHGAPLVLPFAGIELLALGLALAVVARHAGDFEAIDLRGGRLTVEHACGARIERAEFQPAWLRIEPRHGERSLIELSGRGQRIAVGRFVRPEQRRALADELRGAVRTAVSFSSPPATT